MSFSLQNSRSSVSGRYGCASTWTTAGLILADSQIGNSSLKLMSDSPMARHFAMVHEILHRPPGLEQSHAAVVKDIAVLVPRILLVPRLKGKGSVNEIEIQIVDPESRQTRLESRFDALGSMIRVPQLCGDKDVFTLQSFPHLTLVPVSFRTIEVSKSSFQRVSGRTYRRAASGIRVTKPSTGL